MTRCLIACFLLLAACGEYCDLERVAECPDCGPGEVRHAFVLGGEGGRIAIDGTSEGTICATCDSILVFDSTFEARQLLGFEVAYGEVAASGDTIYMLRHDPGESDEEDNLPLTGHTLIAFAADGRERWRKDLGASLGSWFLSAGPEGLYVSSSQGLEQERETVGFDADGNERWRDGDVDLLVPDGTGGAFTTSHRYSSDLETSEATITSRDRLGAPRWSRTWKATDGTAQGGGDVYIHHAAAGSGGELAILGSFDGTALDLGDRILNQQDSSATFVAWLGADGATKWAVVLGRNNAQRVRVAVAGDQVILGGEYTREGDGLGLPNADDVDGFVAVVDSTGLVRSTLLGGPGYQAVDDLRSGPDGTVSITLTNAYGEDVGAQLTIGSTTFEAGKYADDHNRIYLINMLP